MKKKLLKSVLFTVATVMVGLSSIAGEKLRREDRRRRSPERRTKGGNLRYSAAVSARERRR